MAKKGMARPDWTKLHPKNSVSPVPQIQGKARSGKKKAKTGKNLLHFAFAICVRAGCDFGRAEE